MGDSVAVLHRDRNDSNVVGLRMSVPKLDGTPGRNDGLYLNFPGYGEEGEELVRAAQSQEMHGRLDALKNEYDSENRFRVDQNIEPTT